MIETTPDVRISHEPITLVPSSIKWWVMIVAGAGFAALLLVNFGAAVGPLVMAALCMLVAAVAAAMLAPGANLLRLDTDDFEVTHLFRTRRYRWSDASDFAVHSLGQSGDVVAFTTTDPPGGLWSKTNAALLGERNAYLPDTYGMTAEALAKLMAARQSRA